MDPERRSSGESEPTTGGGPLRTALTVLWILALVGYPLAVFVLLQRFSSRHVALTLLILLLPGLVRRGLRYRRGTATVLAQAFGIAGLLGLAALFDSQAFLLHLPVFITGLLMLSFAWTLVRPPVMIERYARLLAPDLTAAEVRYCRTLTWIWVLFFLANGLLIEGLILWASVEAWTLYVGVIGYLVLGLLFGGELIYRRRRFGRFGLPWLDRQFDRLFVRREVAPGGEEGDG